MDPAHQGLPGTALVGARWTVCPPLLPDELLSSWLVRAALAQGCDPLVLTGHVWPRWRVWTVDPDRGLPEERLRVLSQSTGIAVEAFQATTLSLLCPGVKASLQPGPAIWPWILALGSRNRRRLGGLQACPGCLTDDHRPYYRRVWRLAWHTTCVCHGALLDRCPECRAPLQPHRLTADRPITACAVCHADLRLARMSGTPGLTQALTFQMQADDVVRRGWGRYGAHALETADWFSLARTFLRVRRWVALGRADALQRLLVALGVAEPERGSPTTGLPLELLPVGERVTLLGDVQVMLNAGPARFLSEAVKEGVTASALRERGQVLPPVLAGLIQGLPELRVKSRRAAEPNAASPRSRTTVMRRMARLRRKVQA